MNWISVEDRLPEEIDDITVPYNVVVVYDNSCYSDCAWWDGEQFRSPLFAGNIHKYITHWKSLPEPSKEDE